MTERATLHTVASTRTRHAGNVGRWGYVVRENGAYNKTAPEVALTNNRGLDEHLTEEGASVLWTR